MQGQQRRAITQALRQNCALQKRLNAANQGLQVATQRIASLRSATASLKVKYKGSISFLQRVTSQEPYKQYYGRSSIPSCQQKR